ncbi:hypothetical protein [Streptoalloteichus hindustanus]|nr:hypothetical protein [Streptoalloteichus hindustanus]
MVLDGANAFDGHSREFALRFGANEAKAAIWLLIVEGIVTTTTVEL